MPTGNKGKKDKKDKKEHFRSKKEKSTKTKKPKYVYHDGSERDVRSDEEKVEQADIEL